MRTEYSHPRDEELLMAADGGLSGRRATRVHAHLAACWDCRALMAEMKDTIADFVRVRRSHLDSELPPIDGARTQLRDRLAELAGRRQVGLWTWFLHIGMATRVTAYICLIFFATAVLSKMFVLHPTMSTPDSAVGIAQAEAVPNRRLTPGAARQVAVREVCVMAHEEVVKDVPAALRQQVFQEYGIANADAGNYEVDYLITPGLGGIEDIRNLWPQPNASPTWNSRVKDALEERLHQLVCSGKLDLPTAQREIATNWIAAYRKYFSTDQPLPLGSDQASNRQ
jgi:hypothetical protein